MDFSETAHYFEQIFNHAKHNAIIIMEADGTVFQVNEAFTGAFGYTSADLHNRHYRLLYIEKDQITRIPEMELNTVHREGSSSDENYLVHKDGTPIWVTGEAILVATGEHTHIVKIIHNIHAQKQLERYLLSSADLLNSLFESVPQTGLLLLNNQMKVIKANSSFNRMFQLELPLTEGCKLPEIGHPFWSSEEIKRDVRNAIVNGTAIKNDYTLTQSDKHFKKLHIVSKLLVSEMSMEREVLLMIKEV